MRCNCNHATISHVSLWAKLTGHFKKPNFCRVVGCYCTRFKLRVK